MSIDIFLNKVFITGDEAAYIAKAIAGSQNGEMISGDGSFTHRASEYLEKKFHVDQVLLTHSCTAALEMAAILADIQPGDEVIMPSYTFVSSANAFVLRGGVPVFVDIRLDTMNMDEKLIEAAITDKTKAIVPVHYAGVACEMDRIMELAEKYNLIVIEDAAQAIFSNYKGRPLGTIGHLGCFSFHETKNIISGEGGALFINRPEMTARAEIIREKGTDRKAFLEGRVDKYTWRDIGSSYLPSDMLAAFLLAQLEHGEEITERRMKAWNIYDEILRPTGLLQLPEYGNSNQPNGHMYFGLVHDASKRRAFINGMAEQGIQALSHFVPLHTSPAGEKFCRISGSMEKTVSGAARLVRLPMYCGVEEHAERIANTAKEVLAGL